MCSVLLTLTMVLMVLVVTVVRYMLLVLMLTCVRFVAGVITVDASVHCRECCGVCWY